MIGRTFGKYRIVEQIGAGGMGVVYRAEHTLLGSFAALKMLLPTHVQEQDVVTRFINEARATAAVKHAGIVDILDVGRELDCVYMLMEYLSGELLAHRLARVGRMPVPQALRLCGHLARSLAVAHHAGIVHRDLKPDNIFLIEDLAEDGGERTKIIDFGIAKLLDTNSAASLTRTGVIMGTPVYMAPEQCKGKGHVDHRADLYALGCILFHMMCGQPPFHGDGAGEILAQHIFVPPPQPSTILQTPEPEVDAFMAHVLAKDAQNRIQSAEQMVSVIDALLQRRPMSHVHIASLPSTVSDTAATRVLARIPVAQTTLNSSASVVSMPVSGQPRRTRLAASLLFASVTALLVVGALWTADVPDPSPSPASPVATKPIIDASAHSMGRTMDARIPQRIDITDAGTGVGDRRVDAGAVIESEARIYVIDSQPPGAQLFKGERLIGVTRHEISISPGQTYRLRIEMAGFLSSNITVPDDDDNGDGVVAVMLERQPVGRSRANEPQDTREPESDSRTKNPKTRSSSKRSPFKKQVDLDRVTPRELGWDD